MELYEYEYAFGNFDEPTPIDQILQENNNALSLDPAINDFAMYDEWNLFSSLDNFNSPSMNLKLKQGRHLIVIF